MHAIYFYIYYEYETEAYLEQVHSNRIYSQRVVSNVGYIFKHMLAPKLLQKN